jgi:hypothetical protein
VGFDKWAWFYAVCADPRIPGAEAKVLLYCAARYVLHAEETFCVRQAVIAERCAVSVPTVKRAFALGRQLGYLVIAEPRRRGRGHRRADEHRLVVPPEIGINLTPISGVDNEIGITGDQNRDHRRSEIGITADSVTSENDDPIGFLKDLDKGLASAPAETAPPPDADGWLHDELDRYAQRLQGIPDCPRCDDDGYLPDDTQCWHGQKPPGEQT